MIFIKKKYCRVDLTYNTTNYNENDERSLPIGNNEKEIGFFKNNLGEKIMTEFAEVRAKAWAYLLNEDSKKKKAKGIKKCVIKEDLCLKILRIAN